MKIDGILKTLPIKAGFCAYTRVCDKDIYNYQLFEMPYTQPQTSSKNLIPLLTKLCSCCFKFYGTKTYAMKVRSLRIFSESFVHKSVNGSIFPGSKSIPFGCLCSQTQCWSSQDCIIAGPSHTVTRSFPGCCVLPLETGLLLDPILSPCSRSKLSLFTILNSTLFQIFF